MQSHLHAACDKEKPSATSTITTEWNALPVLGCWCAFDLLAAGTDGPVLLRVSGTPELLSFRRRLLAGATVDMADAFGSADAARRLEARVDDISPNFGRWSRAKTSVGKIGATLGIAL